MMSRRRSDAGKFRRLRTACLVVLWAVVAIASPAQTLTTIYVFCPNGACAPSDGANPTGTLAQGADGNLYGTTYNGYLFQVSPSGRLVFTAATEGAIETGGLVLATNGDLYGTTYLPGLAFKMTPGGSVTTFPASTPGEPAGSFVQATNKNLYGTGVNGGLYDSGTVFQMTLSGALSTLYSFCSLSGCADGVYPEAGLVQGKNGDFYGTTSKGGMYNNCGSGGCGTVFKISAKGELTTLHNFCAETGAYGSCTDGAEPYSPLILGSDGNFYGTTPVNGSGTYLGNRAYGGTIFRMTPSGQFTTLYSFCSQPDCTDGAGPFAGLVEGIDGNFYGTTTQGGNVVPYVPGYGTIFQITPGGSLTTLYSFCAEATCPDGEYPYASLIEGTDGIFYGVTQYGGSAAGAGTVFSLDLGLRAFLTEVPTAAKIGSAVTILGNNLTGATGVTFDDAPATTFTVNATGTALSATVPTGATTGTISITLSSGGTLSSNIPFRVLP